MRFIQRNVYSPYNPTCEKCIQCQIQPYVFYIFLIVYYYCKEDIYVHKYFRQYNVYIVVCYIVNKRGIIHDMDVHDYRQIMWRMAYYECYEL